MWWSFRWLILSLFFLAKIDTTFATKTPPRSSLPKFQNFITLYFWERCRVTITKNSLQRKCFGAIVTNFIKFTKQSLQIKFLGLFSCQKGHTSGSNIAKELFWWNYFCNNYNDYYKRKCSKESFCNHVGQDGNGPCNIWWSFSLPSWGPLQHVFGRMCFWEKNLQGLRLQEWFYKNMFRGIVLKLFRPWC